MCDQAKQIAVLEGDVRVIKEVLGSIKTNQEKILDNSHIHELESERYRVLIDELIDEKKAKVARTDAITQKIITSGVWGIIVLIVGLAWAGLKGKIGAG